MTWKLHLDLEDDQDPTPGSWRRRVAASAFVILTSVWIVALTVLGGWLVHHLLP